MFTLTEIIEILITSIAVSYIFTAFIPITRSSNPFEYVKSLYKPIDWQQFKTAAIIGVPAVLIHELFHKFASLIMGIPAHYTIGTFFGIPGGGLLIGIVLRLANSSFIFFAPGYVSILGSPTPVQLFVIAFAGPLANILLFIGATMLLKYGKVDKKYIPIIYLTKRINLWLFIFNMLPIPPLDGSKVLIGLYYMIKGVLL